MSVLSAERWKAASPHLEEALEMDEGGRNAMIASLRLRDPGLAADVEGLLRHADAVKRERFLGEAAPIPAGASSLAGTRVGAYTLVSQIGQGGMGGVWLARRSDGLYQGLAAVKLLNPALVGRAGEERFRREGAFLARLTHPNIARLLDAGVSPTGQPYLVLEHIEGEQIDRYCDAARLDVDARVRLFLGVLAAVAHAHANLIVHRDLKPSNVLVDRDGRVRLLDFGIAKLLDDEGAAGEQTELTRDGGRMLTPEYAAPEQLTGRTVTTATDVYALGVLLYVLLAGRHPAGAVRSAADLVQAVVNGEPRRLSDVAGNASGSAAETPLDTAANRAATPDSLRRALRGDLETVVAKAVKKKPEERYESVGAFADDLRRYLDGEPVRARPDSFAYRAAKFVRRHARGVAAAAAFSLLLAALVGYYTARLAAERDVALLQAAKATQVSNLLTGLLTGADPYATEHGPELTVRALLDKGASRIEKELVGQPELQAVMLTVMGRVYQRLGALDRAQGLLERGLAAGRSAFGANDPHVAETLNDLGVVLDEKGDFAAAQRLLENALELRRRLLGPEHREVAVTMVELGRAYGDQGLDAKAEPLFREALAIRRKALGENDHETATSENELGLLLWRKGDLDGAEALFRRCLATDRKTTGDASPDVATALNNLALISMTRGDFAGAEPRLREALAIRRATLGARHPDLVPTLNNLATVLKEERRYDEAASTIEEALAIGRPALGDSHPLIAICWVTKAEIELARSDAAVAEPLLRRALAIQEATYRTRDWRMGLTESLLGEALTALRRYPEAERALVAARSILRDVPGREGEVAAANRARMVALDKARRASVR